MKKIFITRDIGKNALKIISDANICVDIWNSETPPTTQELINRSKDVDGLLTMITENIDQKVINACPNLKVISNMAVGVDNINLDLCKKHHINVFNTPDVLTQSTAELALTLMLMCAKNIPYHQSKLTNGDVAPWHPFLELSQELYGKNLGIIGMGRIGQRFAELCYKAFSLNIYYLIHSNEKKLNIPTTPLKNIAELCELSDIISLHVDLNDSSNQLINKGNLRMMKRRSPIIINTSRGDVICQDDLLWALENNLVSMAGLDVTSPEPLPPNHPLLLHKKAIITPHLGSATVTARNSMAKLAAQNIVKGLNRPKNFSI